MKRDRRVKILATLGPSSADQATIEQLYRAGADVFRINMSHTDHGRLRDLIARIRAVEDKVGRPIGILADLQGPKLRIGSLAGGSVALAAGAAFTLDNDPAPGDATRVHLPHPEILAAVQAGHRLLLDDGKIRLKCTGKTGDRALRTTVEVAGRLSDRKGVSLPDTTLAIGSLTEKDRADAEAALEAGCDWLALSFVQRPEDLTEAHKIARGRAAVLAKIEKPQALVRLAEIIALADALMVARGDLGVEMPLEQVPGLQKQICRACRQAGKPVVVATQMLESMIVTPVPTRAEVSDVATAVFEGVDAVMLSAESAAGKYPVEAVATMSRVAEAVERDPNHRRIVDAQHGERDPSGAGALAAAARQIAETLNLANIVCYTSSGSTGLRIARERPPTPVIASSPVPATARRLAMVWGLHCVISEEVRDHEEMVQKACHLSLQEGFAQPGERIIIVAGMPFGTSGSTNMLRLAVAGSQ